MTLRPWLRSAWTGSKPHCVRVYSGTSPMRIMSCMSCVQGINPGGSTGPAQWQPQCSSAVRTKPGSRVVSPACREGGSGHYTTDLMDSMRQPGSSKHAWWPGPVWPGMGEASQNGSTQTPRNLPSCLGCRLMIDDSQTRAHISLPGGPKYHPTYRDQAATHDAMIILRQISWGALLPNNFGPAWAQKGTRGSGTKPEPPIRPPPPPAQEPLLSRPVGGRSRCLSLSNAWRVTVR